MQSSWTLLLQLIVAVFVTWGPTSVQSFWRVDLNGDGWMITETSSNTKIAGRVPGSIYTALINNGTIGDPLYRDNDVKYAWIGNTDWSYSRTFSVSVEVTKFKQIWLVSEGLDTVATVQLNGQVVGQSDNMFVRSAFNVTGVIKSGDNTIVIQFKSAVKEAAARAQSSAYPIPPACPPAAQVGQCHVNQLRKEQCSFSWDWGPSFPTQGIWKPIYIDAYDNAVLIDATANVRKDAFQWHIDLDVYFSVDTSSTSVQGRLFISLPELRINIVQDLTLSRTNRSSRISIPVPLTTQVPLWWPNGYGGQPLVILNLAFSSGNDMSSRSLRIGFRTVELVQEPVSNKTTQGLSFYFRINGIPIFLKGSNWIPADSFQERITDDRLRFLLQSAASVSMNSMRVWGGGVYESDEFYHLCDQLGILVWQDFMFSVALYPTYQSFLDSVTTEVTQQVRRLKSHPSILAWSGNNENEGALSQDWFGIRANYSLYYNDYVRLYNSTIKPIVEQEDPTRVYLLSSPSNGKETEQEGDVAQNPSSELYGDIHFYDYSVDQWKATSFRIPRMATEYGVQAWCNSESLANVFEPSDYAMDSAMVNHRQHHPGGNQEMQAEVKLHLNLPNSTDPYANFVDFIYLTQINQAMSIKTQSEHYRRHQTHLGSDGRGLTMGALYWQINDIWQAPTWASIDYEGNFKMLHYYAKSFFNKTLVSPYLLDANTLDVFLLLDEVPVIDFRNPSDGRISFVLATDSADLIQRGLPVSEAVAKVKAASLVSNGSLEVQIYDYSSFTALYTWTVAYNVKTPAESVFTKKISDLLSESGCTAVGNCLLHFKATNQAGSVVSTNWFPLAYPNASNLKRAQLKISSVTQLDQNTFKIEISSDAVALFVWLSVEDIQGSFSNNGFAQLSPTKQILFYARQAVTVETLSSQLKVRSVAK